ncbi:MAG: dihydroneopterin aldolase [Muribaculaceae bacterium]|nr:dihydroneopterin aldolase [Muribaculaceae bacterium]MDE6008988.1 dihydroneopterin aldolase [Muribaculaceae bacterium]
MYFEIALNNLRFHSFHGVFPQETKVGNEFIVNLIVRVPPSDAMINDLPEGTVSYADLYAVVEEEMKKPGKLLESVAERIRASLLDKFPQIESGQVSICKSTPPIANISGSATVCLFF